MEYVDDIDALLDSEPELCEASLPESPIRPGKLKKTETTTQPEAPAKQAMVLPHVLEQLDEKEFYEEARLVLSYYLGKTIHIDKKMGRSYIIEGNIMFIRNR